MEQVSMPLTSNPYSGMHDSGNQPRIPERRIYRVLPKPAAVVSSAAAMEMILRNMVLDGDPFAAWEGAIATQPYLKYLNGFGTQVVIRMLRSAQRFQGFKVEFDQHVLKSHVLFTLGTLVNDFDIANTSPLMGVKALDIGCGALSDYASSALESTTDLLTQFYLDHPPILAELLQLLGAQTLGVDPREHAPSTYSYTPTYRHVSLSFPEIQGWLQKLRQPVDLICCFNLFHRPDFSYHYPSPQRLSSFFKGLHTGLSPQGLVFTSTPLIPATDENRMMNRRIFTNAGFRVIYEGYYMILEPQQSTSS